MSVDQFHLLPADLKFQGPGIVGKLLFIPYSCKKAGNARLLESPSQDELGQADTPAFGYRPDPVKKFIDLDNVPQLVIRRIRAGIPAPELVIRLYLAGKYAPLKGTTP